METQLSVSPLPFFFIGKDNTKSRVNAYLESKHVLLSNALGRPDTKSIWYSKEHIEKLLDEINYAGGDGVRIQFGTYEPEHEYGGQTCLLMNVTRASTQGQNVSHVNMVLENEPDFTERSKLQRTVISFPKGDPFGKLVRDFNYGSPCPPRCDGDEDPENPLPPLPDPTDDGDGE